MAPGCGLCRRGGTPPGCRLSAAGRRPWPLVSEASTGSDIMKSRRVVMLRPAKLAPTGGQQFPFRAVVKRLGLSLAMAFVVMA